MVATDPQQTCREYLSRWPTWRGELAEVPGTEIEVVRVYLGTREFTAEEFAELIESGRAQVPSKLKLRYVETSGTPVA